MKIEKRDRAKLGIALLLLIMVPLFLSYTVSNVSGLSTLTAQSYNPTTAAISGYPRTGITNATSTYYEAQTATYTNSTYTASIASLDFDPCTSPTGALIQAKVNTTAFASVTIARVRISWFYVGTGNLTHLQLAESLPTAKTFYDGSSEQDLAENGTYNWDLETFQASQFKTVTQFSIYFQFGDSDDLPEDTDYFEYSIVFYVSSSLLTQTQLLETIAFGVGLMFFIGGIASTSFWNPTKPKYRR